MPSQAESRSFSLCTTAAEEAGSLELAAWKDMALGLPQLMGGCREGTNGQKWNRSEKRTKSRSRSCSLSERDPPADDGWNRPAVSLQ